MDRRIFAILLVLLIGAAPAAAQEQEIDNLTKFMRAKLIHSQKVLEALATEDFAAISKHSQELSLISQAEIWQVIQTPQYLEHSTAFRRSADSLTKAGKDKNLDGAALAYVEMTLKCVSCHKYMRQVRQAKLELPALRR